MYKHVYIEILYIDPGNVYAGDLSTMDNNIT